ncbi:MAG TPA: hypothetical protein VF517_14905 [Thermoleophilaceae bacterium]|jgi:hypothetical protein
MTGPAPSGHITRRSLLLAGAGAAAAAAIPDIALAAKEKVLRRSHLDRSTWEPLVGTTMWVRNRGVAPVQITLVKVADLNTPKQTEAYKKKAFYLVFQGPADQPLAADTHLIKLDGIGKVPVWFSSARQIPEGWEYVAVFANSKIKARPRKKPRTKGSKEQGRRSGERAEDRRKKRRKKDTSSAPKAERRAPEPAPSDAAPAPAPAQPAESLTPAG